MHFSNVFIDFKDRKDMISKRRMFYAGFKEKRIFFQHCTKYHSGFIQETAHADAELLFLLKETDQQFEIFLIEIKKQIICASILMKNVE